MAMAENRIRLFNSSSWTLSMYARYTNESVVSGTETKRRWLRHVLYRTRHAKCKWTNLCQNCATGSWHYTLFITKLARIVMPIIHRENNSLQISANVSPLLYVQWLLVCIFQVRLEVQNASPLTFSLYFVQYQIGGPFHILFAF